MQIGIVVEKDLDRAIIRTLAKKIRPKDTIRVVQCPLAEFHGTYPPRRVGELWERDCDYIAFVYAAERHDSLENILSSRQWGLRDSAEVYLATPDLRSWAHAGGCRITSEEAKADWTMAEMETRLRAELDVEAARTSPTCALFVDWLRSL